jgi:transcriptional regulator with XRE-family HTH domain
MPPPRKKPPRGPELAALGEAFEQLRKEKGWTQEKVGSPNYRDHKLAGEVERGRRDAKFLTLMRLARTLGIPLSEVIARTERILEKRRAEGHLESSDSDQTSSTRRSHSASTSSAQP